MEKKSYDVITFGGCTLDIFADTFDRNHLSKRDKKMRYEHVISYPVGEKILIKYMETSIGGGGTNTALTFSKFGLKTAYCGCVGNDNTANIVKDFLEKNNIDFFGHKSNKNSGLSVILDSIEHDRTILTHKGANDDLDFNRIKLPSETGLFYFSSLLNGAFETQKKLMKLAEKRKIRTAFNPSSYEAKQGVKKLKDVLEKTNILILNKEEAQDLLEDLDPHPSSLAKKLKKYLNKSSLVVITDGPNGAYTYDGYITYKVIPGNIKVVESTGAGDAFASAFISSLIKGESISSSLKIATANSESVITHKGAKEVILTYEQAKKNANKSKYKVEKI
ncbi:MAG: carbohydrate kinase family protein [Nanobdellota archaeon]